MENVNISGIKINGGGLKGLEVCYSKVEKGKDGRDWINEYWTSRSFPVNKELDALVKAFRFYLYDIYGYDMDSVNDAELEVGEIKGDGNSFKIKGKMKVLDGDKFVKLESPKVIEEDGYGKYVEVMALISQLYREVEMYMEGKRDNLDNLSVVKAGVKKGELFDEVEFQMLSAEDQKDMATKVLEKLGSIVIHRDDMGEDEVMEDSKEVSREIKPVSEVIKAVVETMPNFSSSTTTMDQVLSVGAVINEENIGSPTTVVSHIVSKGSVATIKPMGMSQTPVPNFDAVPEEKKVVNFTNGDEEDDDFSLAVTPIKRMNG